MNNLIKNMKPLTWSMVLIYLVLSALGAACISLVTAWSLASFLLYLLILFVALLLIGGLFEFARRQLNK
jgi:hypothetical protein